MHFFLNLPFKTITYITIIICLYSISAFSSPESQTDIPKRTVVVDPGHGGFDTGAKGADNTLEKNISLLFAKKIKACLEKKYNVVLTRKDDYWVETRQRAEIANNTKAELFISVHTSASFIRETKGLSLIYYKPPSTDTDLILSENQTQWNQTQEKYIPLSRLFTKGLYKRLSKNPNHQFSRMSNLPLSFLSGINMPAILIEVGYLTNPSEEKQLKNQDYLSDYIKEICAEIDIFLEEHPIIY